MGGWFVFRFFWIMYDTMLRIKHEQEIYDTFCNGKTGKEWSRNFCDHHAIEKNLSLFPESVRVWMGSLCEGALCSAIPTILIIIGVILAVTFIMKLGHNMGENFIAKYDLSASAPTKRNTIKSLLRRDLPGPKIRQIESSDDLEYHRS